MEDSVRMHGIGETQSIQPFQLFCVALQAATCEEFCRAMFHGSPYASLDPAMMRWYDTNGTPELTIKTTYSPAKQSLTLTVTQELETAKAPLLIPLKVRQTVEALGVWASAECLLQAMA
jgi:aminopeptidase N